MIYTEHGLNVLTTLSFKGIGRAWGVKHMQTPQRLEQFIPHLASAVKEREEVSLGIFLERRKQIQTKLLQCSSYMDGMVAIGDNNFPKYNAQPPKGERPIALFYKGDISLLSETYLRVAVVGLLSPDEAIEISERLTVSELVSKGAVIVSGLALGCDSIAHEQTLRDGGKTIAILPGTLQKIIPASNKALADQILATGGLLITEYHEEAHSKMEQTTRYIERDRLQALFSHHIILAASYAPNKDGKDSGSRHALGKAKEYGIPRSVIYNEHKHCHNEMFDLNRQILREDPSVSKIDSHNLLDVVKRISRMEEKELSPRDLFGY